MKRFLPVLLVFAVVYLYQALNPPARTPHTGSSAGSMAVETDSRTSLRPSFVDGQQARGSGTVVRVLPDDIDGSRHQRFILRLASGRTLLIAHNIDLAPRIAGIREGDTVEFFGEFRTNSQGGVIHWTHHDPQGFHPGGWLRHNGATYE